MTQVSAPAGDPIQDEKKAGIPQGLTVVIAAFLPILAIVSMFPGLPGMIEHFSADPDARWKVPSMVSAPGLTIAAVALFAGMLVDRFGRRRLLLISTLMYGVFGTAPFFLESLDQVYASRLLLGLSEAMILTTLNTLIGDYWVDRDRRNWLTVQGMLGPALSSGVLFFAGALAEWRWNGIFLVYAVAFPIFLCMLAFLFEPKSDATARAMLGIGKAPAARSPFPWAAIARIGLVTLVSSALYYVFIINGGSVWKEIGISNPRQIGEMTALPSLFILAGAALFWILGRVGLPASGQIFVFLLLLGSGLAMMGLAKDPAGVLAGMSLQQTGAGMAVPVLIAWAQTNLPFEHRGRGMGFWTACFFFGQFSSPLLVDMLRGANGTMQAAFVTSGLIGLGSALVLFVLLTVWKSPAPQQA